ncbi:hypothetical protein PR003_g25570 [Phytophthora rubi]|uniref:Integrase catalytic domain-containing protein n=1 Tax=Phytophthora rubi TaxID=129364 RepID=A0A6A4CH09_9STRA|nr:hypothetical protein PR003_g25570 [Phytophthora rubi]
MGAGITPRDKLDQIAESLIPAKKQVIRTPPISLEMLEADYEGWLLSFDGAAKMSDRRGSAGCVLWKLPSWDVIEAQGFHFEDATVNEAEYHGLIEGAKMALARGISEIVIAGDSRIAIQQAQGLIQCLSPSLQLLLNEFDELHPKFKSVKLVHVKREFNAAADYLTSKTLADRCTVTLEDPVELAQLKQLNRIAEKLVREPIHADERKPNEVESKIIPEPVSLVQAAEPLSPDAKIFVVTRRQARAEESPIGEDRGADRDEIPASEEVTSGFSPETATPAMTIAERWRRILAQQGAELWIRRLRDYLEGDLTDLSAAEAEDVAKIANQIVLDSRGALYYLSRATPNRPRDQAEMLRLVVPRSLQADLLHLSHEYFQGAHQGITRTFERLRQEYYWPGMYADVERFVNECVDCVTAKGAPPNPGPSPGNILATRPFEAVSMDFVTHLPKSDRGNVFLLLFQCMFSGFVICKPMSSTTAQEVAKAYMDRVFQRFGASEMIRHDRDPRFMSEVFAKFREMLGSRQRATLAYRPQANGQQERSVQTVIRAVRA